MDDNETLNPAPIDTPPETRAHASAKIRDSSASLAAPRGRERTFWALWRVCSALLILSVILLAYSAIWEFSTRRYLKGFSDAIVPANSEPAVKIQAILSWMSGPAAKDTDPSAVNNDRDPEDTLNYTTLLQVCGTATNAFINLADSAGLRARRLLLLNSNRTAKHVVAEVYVGGRWIIVDPVFRFIPRGRDGGFLTRRELADPAIFAEATRNIPNYNPAYDYQITSHVHLSRIPYVGRTARRILDALIPGWSDSTEVSLLLERNSLAALAFSVLLVVFVLLLRVALRWYAAARLHVRPAHVYVHLARACIGFFRRAA